MERIYLDYAASAPLGPESKKAIDTFIKNEPIGNPSSLHHEGRRMQAHLDQVHTTIGAVFGVHPTEVVLTSGATESNNLAIRGVLAAWRAQNPAKIPHVVVSAIEHPSWLQAIKSENADVTVVPVTTSGVVSAHTVMTAINPNTALVGCSYVNNEIGTIQPVEMIGKGVETWRADKKSVWPVFHIDAVQAFPYLNTHIGHTHADLMTISGHKYGALGGIGTLIIKKGAPIISTLKGGSQEWGYRAGTENILGALTLAEAIKWNDANRDQLFAHASKLQEILETELMTMANIEILANRSARAPHITYIWSGDLDSGEIVTKLDLAGIAVSSGSACSSGAQLPSNTLMALGMSSKQAYGGIRVSYGRFTTEQEISRFIHVFTSLL